MPHRVSHKSVSGLQQIRKDDKTAQVLRGSAASFVQNPDKTLGKAEFCIPHGDEINVDINTFGKNGIINGLVGGKPKEGIYYMFLGSDGVPDANGVLPFQDTYAYLSKYFEGYGKGNDPSNNPPPPGIYKRPLPATFYIRNNKIEPCMALSENGHNWQRFQFDGYSSWKAPHDENGDAISASTQLQSVGSDRFILTFDNILPVSHKWLELHAIIGGVGSVYASNHAYDGQLIGIAHGNKQVVRWKSMPGSEGSGRALMFKTTGTAFIMRIYVLATQCQQPM